jgi:hypothetical protein
MSKYLKLFENHSQYETFIGGGGRIPICKAKRILLRSGE